MINNQIERFLKGRGVTKKYVAAKMGMSADGFNIAIKTGSLKIRDLYKLANVLEVELCELLGFKQELNTVNAEGKQIIQNSKININANKLEIEILRERLKNSEEVLKNKNKIISNLEREVKNMYEVIEVLKQIKK